MFRVLLQHGTLLLPDGVTTLLICELIPHGPTLLPYLGRRRCAIHSIYVGHCYSQPACYYASSCTCSTRVGQPSSLPAPTHCVKQIHSPPEWTADPPSRRHRNGSTYLLARGHGQCAPVRTRAWDRHWSVHGHTGGKSTHRSRSGLRTSVTLCVQTHVKAKDTFQIF